MGRGRSTCAPGPVGSLDIGIQCEEEAAHEI